MKRILFFTLCFAFSVVTLNAQNYDQVVFTGEGDGYSWEDPENWRRGGDPLFPGVPEPYDDILIEYAYVYFNGLGGVPLNQEYGTLELRYGAHLSTQGDFYLQGDFIVDTSSTLEVIVRDVDLVYNITCEGNYFFNGNMQLAFSGYVPQIGQSFQIINGFQGSCATAQSAISYGDGFEVTIGAQCEFEGLSYVVTDLAYTTAYAWDGEGGDGYWHTAANWNHNEIPPPGSTVIINLPGAGGYAITDGAGVTEAHTIYIGQNNTLEVNGDLLIQKYIYLSKEGTFTWKGGKLYSPDENEQSGMIGYGHINLDGPGLMELDTNFYIWNYFEDINHNGGDLNINNGVLRMFNFNSYNINDDNITIGYNSGDLHEFTISVVSELRKTTGTGTSSINLSTFINYGEIIAESGTLAFNEDITTGEYQEYIDGTLVEYIGTYSGSGTFQFPAGYVLEGEVSPGSSPGVLTIAGNLTTGTNTTFNIEIDGPTVGTEYDRLLVQNNADISGEFNIILGYLPPSDAIFEIVTSTSLTVTDIPETVEAEYGGNFVIFSVEIKDESIYLLGPDATLGIDQVATLEVLNIYPNPAIDAINIKSQTLINGEWRLINQLGQVVNNGNFKSTHTKINTHGLTPGLYFLNIHDKSTNQVVVKKVMISN